MYDLHVVPKLVHRHSYSALINNYPCLIPLPKSGTLTRRQLLVCVIYQTPTNEAKGACHGLGITQVHVQPHTIKHLYDCCQSSLHPDGVLLVMQTLSE